MGGGDRRSGRAATCLAGPAKLPGTIEEIKEGRVEPATVPAAVAVSLVSLVGGASLGPEDALGKMGGWL